MNLESGTLRHLWWVTGVVAVVAAGLGVAACGDDAPKTVGTPRLVGTPIPSVPRPTNTPPACVVTASATVPPEFPAEFPIPDGFQATSVETDPYLKVAGRVTVDIENLPNTAEFAVAGEILDAIFRVWELKQDAKVEGSMYTFTNEDGREGTFHAVGVLLCPEHVDLTYEFPWITPSAGN